MTIETDILKILTNMGLPQVDILNEVSTDLNVTDEGINVPLDWEIEDVFRHNFYKVPAGNLTRIEEQPNPDLGQFRFLSIHLTGKVIRTFRNLRLNRINAIGIYFLRKIERISRVPLREIGNRYGKRFANGDNEYWLFTLSDWIVFENFPIPPMGARGGNKYTNFQNIRNAQSYTDI